MYRVVAVGRNGKPDVIEVVRMGVKETWRFVMSDGGDMLFEKD